MATWADLLGALFDVSVDLDIGQAVRALAPSGPTGQPSGVYDRAPTSNGPAAAPRASIRSDRLFDLRTPEGRDAFRTWRWEYEDRWAFASCDTWTVFRAWELHLPYQDPDVWGSRCPRVDPMTLAAPRCVLGILAPRAPRGSHPCHAAGSAGDARSGQPCSVSRTGRTRRTTTTTCVASATKATSTA